MCIVPNRYNHVYVTAEYYAKVVDFRWAFIIIYALKGCILCKAKLTQKKKQIKS